LSPLVNSRPSASSRNATVPAYWLGRLPVRFVSHLPPKVLEKMREQIGGNSQATTNDLLELEDRLEYVPLGIDSRSGPVAARAAMALRRRRGFQDEDIVVGHFGLIIDDLKRLRDVIGATARFIADAKRKQDDVRRMFFVLVGKIIDQKLFDDTRSLFQELNIGSRLVHSYPILEDEFDAEIAACDAVFCLRRQTRGQLSHVFVRALSLGRPVIVNEGSGYGYDDRTTVDDEHLERDIRAVLGSLYDRTGVEKMRQRARSEYERTHRGDRSLQQILTGSSNDRISA
jgi:hypothetical protein